jgi:hypothetical protein
MKYQQFLRPFWYLGRVHAFMDLGSSILFEIKFDFGNLLSLLCFFLRLIQDLRELLTLSWGFQNKMKNNIEFHKSLQNIQKGPCFSFFRH